MKNHETLTDNLPTRTCINKIDNIITILNIKSGYYLDLLMPKTMKLVGSTENKIAKDKNGKDIPYLEITEVIVFHCNIVNHDYEKFCIHLFQTIQ